MVIDARLKETNVFEATGLYRICSPGTKVSSRVNAFTFVYYADRLLIISIFPLLFMHSILLYKQACFKVREW